VSIKDREDYNGILGRFRENPNAVLREAASVTEEFSEEVSETFNQSYPDATRDYLDQFMFIEENGDYALIDSAQRSLQALFPNKESLEECFLGYVERCLRNDYRGESGVESQIESKTDNSAKGGYGELNVQEDLVIYEKGNTDAWILSSVTQDAQ
jgi:hypothetical protein